MGYSSVAHLSSQFKKVTGLSPSHFKNLKTKDEVQLKKLGLKIIEIKLSFKNAINFRKKDFNFIIYW
jgi:AraC-like DNA-binding protein